MKILCIAGFVLQFFGVCLMVAVRWLYSEGLVDETLGRMIFDRSEVFIVLISPISFGSAVMSLLAISMLHNPAFNRIWSDHIRLGYPHTWILWREVREKYESLEFEHNG